MIKGFKGLNKLIMNNNKGKIQRVQRRKARVRAKVFGVAQRPRLNVFRSLKHISAQLIDDEKGITLASANDKEVSGVQEDKDNKFAVSYEVGKILAKKAIEANVKSCVFDKSGYKYHGKVKALAEGAREGGLVF